MDFYVGGRTELLTPKNSGNDTTPTFAVTVKLPDGESLRFISTHFQHNLPADRVAEANTIHELFAADNMTSILAGDMHASPGSEPIVILEQDWKNAIDSAAAPSATSSKPQSRNRFLY